MVVTPVRHENHGSGRARGACRRAEEPVAHRDQDGAQPDSRAATRWPRVSGESASGREVPRRRRSLFGLQKLRVGLEIARELALHDGPPDPALSAGAGMVVTSVRQDRA